MNRLAPLTILMVFLFAFGFGCGRTGTKKPAPNPKEAYTEKPLNAACEALAKATAAEEFRQDLFLLTDHMKTDKVRQEIQLTESQREFLKKEVRLTDDEIEEVESATFRPLDAHYLDGCFLLSAAARNLEKTGLPPLELAQHVLAWVCREVVLDAPPKHTWIPSHLILRRGFGTPSDRSLLYLALMRQLGMEGVVLGSPHPLVGILLPEGKDKNLYLFDMVYGLPVRGAKGPATLAEVQKDNALLKANGIPKKDFNRVEFYLNCPLTSLAPRMKVLEELLRDERRVLYMDAAAVHKTIAAAVDKPVRIGNPPVEKGRLRNSPVRSLRMFMPPEEGGVDRGNQWQIYQSARLPVPQVLANFRKLNIFPPAGLPDDVQNLPEKARLHLLSQSLDLFKKFSMQPREMLIRGKNSDLVKRLDRIRTALEDFEFTNLEDRQFLSELAFWRKELVTVYSTGNPAKIAEFWTRDQFILTLPQVDMELDKKLPKTILTHLYFTVTKDLLDQNTRYLLGMGHLEKAEFYQAMADYLRNAGKDAKAAQENAGEAWLNCKGEWGKYTTRYGLSPPALRNRLIQMQDLLKRNETDAANFQILMRDWSTACAARLQYAHILEMAGQPKVALNILDGLEKDLESVAALDSPLAKEVENCLNLLDTKLKDGRIPGDVAKVIFENQREIAREFSGEGTILEAVKHLADRQRKRLR